jgi:hypothetical protein
MKRIAHRTYIGLALALGCGLLPFVYLFVGFLHSIPSGTILKEEIVTKASFSIPIFTLTAVGVALFWAVRDSRLYWAWAALLFLAAAIVSLFVPGPLMTASTVFWPSNFHGDSGFAVLLAPLGMALFAVPAVIAFAVSLIFACWHSHAAPASRNGDAARIGRLGCEN